MSGEAIERGAEALLTARRRTDMVRDCLKAAEAQLSRQLTRARVRATRDPSRATDELAQVIRISHSWPEEAKRALRAAEALEAAAQDIVRAERVRSDLIAHGQAEIGWAEDDQDREAARVAARTAREEMDAHVQAAWRRFEALSDG